MCASLCFASRLKSSSSSIDPSHFSRNQLLEEVHRRGPLVVDLYSFLELVGNLRLPERLIPRKLVEYQPKHAKCYGAGTGGRMCLGDDSFDLMTFVV